MNLPLSRSPLPVARRVPIFSFFPLFCPSFRRRRRRSPRPPRSPVALLSRQAIVLPQGCVFAPLPRDLKIPDKETPNRKIRGLGAPRAMGEGERKNSAKEGGGNGRKSSLLHSRLLRLSFILPHLGETAGLLPRMLEMFAQSK